MAILIMAHKIKKGGFKKWMKNRKTKAGIPISPAL